MPRLERVSAFARVPPPLLCIIANQHHYAPFLACKVDEYDLTPPCTGVAISKHDEIFVVSGLVQTVLAWSRLGQPGRRIWHNQWGGRVGCLRGIALVPAGDALVVTDTENNCVHVFRIDGTYLRGWGAYGGEHGLFCRPQGLAVSSDGIVYVADTYNHRVQMFDVRTCAFRGVFQFVSHPKDVCLLSTGEVAVLCYHDESVRTYCNGQAQSKQLHEWNSYSTLSMTSRGDMLVLADTHTAKLIWAHPNGTLIRSGKFDNSHSAVRLATFRDGRVLLCQGHRATVFA